MQIKLGSVRYMIAHCFIARSAARAQVKHLGLHAMGLSAFCNLENDLLDTPMESG